MDEDRGIWPEAWPLLGAFHSADGQLFNLWPEGYTNSSTSDLSARPALFPALTPLDQLGIEGWVFFWVSFPSQETQCTPYCS